MHSYNPINPRESLLQSQNDGGSLNLPRRHYVVAPQDHGRNEWRSMIKHYEEVDSKARLMEQYAKRAFQKKAREELENQIAQK